MPYEADDILVTDGAFAGLNLCIRTVTDPGDEVIFLTPPWFFYEAIILGGEANPVRVPVNYETWDLDLDAIEAAITEHTTTAIIVNSPNNPSGKIYPPETLRALADVLTAGSERIGHPIYLISTRPTPGSCSTTGRSRVRPSSTRTRSWSTPTPSSCSRPVSGSANRPAARDARPPRDARGADARAAHLRRPRGADQRPAARVGDLEGMSVDIKALQRRRDLLVKALRSYGYDLHSPRERSTCLPTSPDPGRRRLRRAARAGPGVRAARAVVDAGRFRISVTGNDEMTERALPIFERAAKAQVRRCRSSSLRATGPPPGRAGRGRCAAMRIVVEMAGVAGAERLIDVDSAHVDGCLYHGRAGLEFAERLVTGGARVTVPTTLNVAALDLLHPGPLPRRRETAANARRQMDAYVAMGRRPTWTCAPYQLPERPGFGQHVAWAESNAIVSATRCSARAPTATATSSTSAPR